MKWFVLLLALIGSAIAAAAPKGEEISIFRDRPQQLTNTFGSWRIFLHDHGSETISVSINYGPYQRIKKANGTDSVGDNKVLIWSDGRVLIYHVNTPRAPHDCAILELIVKQ